MITLKTLAQATEQEVFNQVVRHLLIQNKRSLIGSDCAYRSPEGLRCAAGCLIADDEYQHDLEGLTWFALIDHRMVPDYHSDLILALQKVHDGCDPKTWRQELERVAASHGLAMPIGGAQ